MNAASIKSKPEVSSASAIRILKIATCLSLSQTSKITYLVASNAQSEILLRVYSCTGGGYHSQEYISLNAIQKIFAKVPSDDAITSFLLYPLFLGKSTNTPGFMLAALLAEGLVRPSVIKDRCYDCTDGKEFFAMVQALMESGVDLKVDDKPKKHVPDIAEASIKKSASKSGQKKSI